METNEVSSKISPVDCLERFFCAMVQRGRIEEKTDGLPALRG